jgi:hypothetical protein
MLPWEIVIGITAMATGLYLGIVIMAPNRDREISEADALERMSRGFEWRYEHPTLVFTLPDGEEIAFERGWSAGRWFTGPAVSVSRGTVLDEVAARGERRPV